jgi:hypothetical protein
MLLGAGLEAGRHDRGATFWVILLIIDYKYTLQLTGHNLGISHFVHILIYVCELGQKPTLERST